MARAAATICSTSGGSPRSWPDTGARVAAGSRRRLGDQRETGSGRPADEPDGTARLDLRADQLQPHPGSPWPAHIIDVKRAIAWIRENIAEYGGDPDFIAITGGSAGAHVGSLAALTANDPLLQPGFEHVDTSVQAAVPYYGAYDLTDPADMCDLMLPFLERFVMRASLADHPELFAAASPISHVHREAPPFFVLHGRNDAVIPEAQAQLFVDALRATGAGTVAHAELPNAHHAFDTLGHRALPDGRGRGRRLPRNRLRTAANVPAAVLHHAGHAG